jgi:hypothetical protein
MKDLDLPHIIRRQLQDLRQFPEESLEEYAERAHELSTDVYPGTPDSFMQIVATVRCFFERLLTQEGSFDCYSFNAMILMSDFFIPNMTLWFVTA